MMANDYLHFLIGPLFMEGPTRPPLLHSTVSATNLVSSVRSGS